MKPFLASLIALGLFIASLSAAEPAAPDWIKHPENTWVKQSPREGSPVPGFPYEGSGDYDPFTRRWIHHAGHDGIPQGFHTFILDLDTGKWEQHFPPTSPPGVCCVDGANCFDPIARRFVRFPGGMLGHGYQWSRGEKLKDSAVWLYDPVAKNWANMRPLPYAEPEKGPPQGIGGLNSGAVYAPNHELTLSFGGQGVSGGKNTLFAYDAHANTLHHIKAENAPPARDGMGLAYDTRHDVLVMFGSQYSPDERTWLYDLKTNKWEGLNLDPHPPAVKATKEYSTIPRMAYDPVNGIVLCVAWLGDRGHETWAFDVGKRAWTKLSPATEPDPSKSRSRNLGYDPGRNLFILETSGAKSNRPEVWTYRYKAAPAGDRPLLPTDVNVVTAAGGKATVNWKPVVGAKGYEVHRAIVDLPWKAEFQRVGTPKENSFEDTGLESGKVYAYIVKAVAADGTVGAASVRAWTRPTVPTQPVVSVLANDKIEVRWDRHTAAEVVGYNVYRGVVHVRTVVEGTPGAWKDNDPKYDQPQVVQVRNITDLKKLNDAPLTKTTLTDSLDLTKKRPASGEYRFGVSAYIVRAVNRLGTESGPSPYALTIPSELLNVLCREHGEVAELKWDAALEKGVAGYHVYMLEGTWKIVRVTEKPLKETTFRHKVGKGQTRFWVVTVDALGQEGQPSSPAWFNQSYRGFYTGDWHQ
ncbi:MAG: fibronectin type III domain-containing protein [Planctomycetes bacterium]|nr:fibronectin type III domain-containing protein [Planctomycetota bacterium]